MDSKKGYVFAFLTAMVSGFSIFFNSFVVQGLNPFIFTTMKNLFVAIFLLSILFLFKEFSSLKKLSIKQWGKLALIGFVGGSIPFWLFFYAIKVGTELYSTPFGVVAGFFHKATLFVFVGILATVFLKEKLSKGFLVGGLVLLLANFLVAKNLLGFGFAEMLLFSAIILWSIENIISKWTLQELTGNQVAFGRMFFGSIILIAMLFLSGQGQGFLSFDTQTVFWGFATAIPLFFYVFFWYNGLKHIEVSKATAILMLGQPVTVLLSLVFSAKIPTPLELLSIGLIIAGVLLVIGYSNFVSLFKKASKNTLSYNR